MDGQNRNIWTQNDCNTHCVVGFAFPLLIFGFGAAFSFTALVVLDLLGGFCEREVWKDAEYLPERDHKPPTRFRHNLECWSHMSPERVCHQFQGIIAWVKETHGSGMVLALLVDAFFVVIFLDFKAADSWEPSPWVTLSLLRVDLVALGEASVSVSTRFRCDYPCNSFSEEITRLLDIL